MCAVKQPIIATVYILYNGQEKCVKKSQLVYGTNVICRKSWLMIPELIDTKIEPNQNGGILSISIFTTSLFITKWSLHFRNLVK